jgi:hypothetical protein
VVKRPKREADSSPQSNVEAKSGADIPPLLSIYSWHGVLLITLPLPVTLQANPGIGIGTGCRSV